MKWLIKKILIKSPHNNLLLLSEIEEKRRKIILQDIVNTSKILISKYNYQIYNEHKDFIVNPSKLFSNISIYFCNDQEEIYSKYSDEFKKDLMNNIIEIQSVTIEKDIIKPKPKYEKEPDICMTDQQIDEERHGYYYDDG